MASICCRENVKVKEGKDRNKAGARSTRLFQSSGRPGQLTTCDADVFYSVGRMSLVLFLAGRGIHSLDYESSRSKALVRRLGCPWVSWEQRREESSQRVRTRW